MVPRSFAAILVAVVASLVASPLVGITSIGASAPGPEITGYCMTNLQGLGICETEQFCPFKSGDCDAATPCPDGLVCTVGSACPSSLDGVCLEPFPDGGCSNPGTYGGGFEACDFVIFHEDFGLPPVGPEGGLAGLDKLSVNLECGSGGAMFKENVCPGNAGASSPLWTAHWSSDPPSCSSYSGSGHRYSASTGAINIEGCAGAVLDFDYLLSISESGAYDRVFLTAGVDKGPRRVLVTSQSAGEQAFSTSDPSCAGTVLPVGNLFVDGTWHHFHAGIGSGNSVAVGFWAETVDSLFNSGQGWLFDDVRIDCGAELFRDGFEGGNFLRWSFTTAPPLLVGVAAAGMCGTYQPCAGPDSSCYNFKTAEGFIYCLTSSICGASCTTSADCGSDELCIVDSCCGVVAPSGADPRLVPLGVCVAASCDPDASIIVAPGAESAVATTGGGLSRPN